MGIYSFSHMLDHLLLFLLLGVPYWLQLWLESVTSAKDKHEAENLETEAS